MALATTFAANEFSLSVVFTDDSEQSRTATVTLFADLAGLETETDILNRADALLTEYVALSDAAVESATVHFTSNIDASSTVSAEGFDVDDVIVLLFQDQKGGTVRASIPMPDGAVLEADGETVNEGDAAIAAFIAQFLAAAAKVGTVLILEYIRGWRQRRRARTKKLGVSAGHTT